jgi:hypothetical protein
MNYKVSIYISYFRIEIKKTVYCPIRAGITAISRFVRDICSVLTSLSSNPLEELESQAYLRFTVVTVAIHVEVSIWLKSIKIKEKNK